MIDFVERQFSHLLTHITNITKKGKSIIPYERAHIFENIIKVRIGGDMRGGGLFMFVTQLFKLLKWFQRKCL